MSIKITKKAALAQWDCYSVGYAELQYMLGPISPSFHTETVNGWGADVYIIDSRAIVTGYSPFGKKTPCELQEKHNKNALAMSTRRGRLSTAWVYRLARRFLDAVDAYKPKKPAR